MTQPSPYPHDNSVPYQGPAYVDRDQEHLKVLSICWYVAAGLAACMGCFPIIHVSVGLMLIVSPPPGAGPGGPPPAFVGWLFFLMGSAFMVVGWTGAILGFITARSLTRRRRMVLCYIAAALLCLQVPIGTCLGIFTFIVLGRPSVRASFT